MPQVRWNLMFSITMLHKKLLINLELRILELGKYWVETYSGSQSSFWKLNSAMSFRNYAKADITFFWSCPILLNLFVFFQIFTSRIHQLCGPLSPLESLQVCCTLREKCPNTEFFLVRIFPHSDWIRRDTDQKKLRICTFFTRWIGK